MRKWTTRGGSIRSGVPVTTDAPLVLSLPGHGGCVWQFVSASGFHYLCARPLGVSDHTTTWTEWLPQTGLGEFSLEFWSQNPWEPERPCLKELRQAQVPMVAWHLADRLPPPMGPGTWYCVTHWMRAMLSVKPNMPSPKIVLWREAF